MFTDAGVFSDRNVAVPITIDFAIQQDIVPNENMIARRAIEYQQVFAAQWVKIGLSEICANLSDASIVVQFDFQTPLAEFLHQKINRVNEAFFQQHFASPFKIRRYRFSCWWTI